MKLIIDASLALSWLFERKSKDERSCANEVLNEMEKSEVLVPELWHLEIVNTLLVAERRRVVTEAQTLDFLNRISILPIKTDSTKLAIRRESILLLAREHNLSAYDATYLDLALKNDAILATFDTDLAKAMRKAGGMIFNDTKKNHK